VLEPSPERTATFPDVTGYSKGRKRKRHRAQRQKSLERIRKKAQTVILYVLTIGLTLAIWYELLKI